MNEKNTITLIGLLFMGLAALLSNSPATTSNMIACIFTACLMVLGGFTLGLALSMK